MTGKPMTDEPKCTCDAEERKSYYHREECAIEKARVSKDTPQQQGNAAKPQAWIRISYVMDGRRNTVAFAVPSEVAFHECERLKEAGWMVEKV